MDDRDRWPDPGMPSGRDDPLASAGDSWGTGSGDGVPGVGNDVNSVLGNSVGDQFGGQTGFGAGNSWPAGPRRRQRSTLDRLAADPDVRRGMKIGGTLVAARLILGLVIGVVVLIVAIVIGIKVLHGADSVSSPGGLAPASTPGATHPAAAGVLGRSAAA